MLSRMGASLNHAADCDELVCDTTAAYVKTAIDLAGSPDRLAAIRTRLLRASEPGGAFDPGLFAARLEKGIEQVWKRHCQGLAPAHIDVGMPLMNETRES
jgi:predicted O-linked N-acetylglucosamine transferase (SPINDLY family)